ncbi:hypothetical protein D9619_012126 [Psilocybe cf. subviscida]|uniref:Uncharacterized protein n=1 Tax=Psilocybe cf. subviscida TaxID=2480587 RepID=A0A8H5B7K9_9AGAR|nr:hypothetical protein D9619_012126 [Psilocybe cf. subviscida]
MLAGTIKTRPIVRNTMYCAMSQGTAESHHQKPSPLAALDDIPSTPAEPHLTPSPFKKKFSLASISANFQGTESAVDNVRDDDPPHPTADAKGEGKVYTPIATPVASTPDLSPEALSEVVHRDSELTSAPREVTYPGRLNSPDICEPESPSVNLAHRRAKSGGSTGEFGRTVKPFCVDDAQLSYANSMEALSNDFAEHVFPESPLFPTDIPKSEMNIPYPSISVSLRRAKSLDIYTFHEDVAPLKFPVDIEVPADKKVDTLAENAPAGLSPVVEIIESPIVENRSSWLHLAKTVQRAAKHLSDDEDLSPVVLFQALGPIVFLLYGIASGVLLKRYHNELNAAMGLPGAMKPIAMFLTVVVGALITLITLKLTILVTTSLLKTFSEMDLEATFHKGECVDADGKVVGESDLLIGSFLFASPSLPVVA